MAYDHCAGHRVLAGGYDRDAYYAYFDALAGRLEALVIEYHVGVGCSEYGVPPDIDISPCDATPLCEGERPDQLRTLPHL